MSSRDYWEKRKANEMFRYMEQAEKKADEISSLYLKSSRYLSVEMEKIFERFRKKHSLSESEARRLLNTLHDKTSIEELKTALRDSSDPAESEILAELESAAYQARIERLRQLQNQLDLTMQQVYEQEKALNHNFYLDLGNEAYYRSIYDIQQMAGVGFSFNAIDPKVIERVINSRWSGANYSERIWSNTNALARDLKEELLINLMTGRTDREVSEIIANKFAVGASKARRLVRTESCNLATQMDMAGYEECGIETYIFVATLDLKTSKVCRKLDGKRFPVSEQQPGKNCPPMHPWCRSTTICDISDEELSQMKRRARDPVTGKTKLVPADMSYEEWKEQYIDSDITVNSSEKQIREYLEKLKNKKIEWLKDHSYDIYGDTVEEMEKGFWEEAEDGSMPGESSFMESINRKIDNIYQKLGYKNIVADGKKSYTKTIKGMHSIEDDLKAINPNYEPSSYKWASNCQRCVPAYEMRRRGFDVVAKPRKRGKDDTASSWRTIFKDAQWEICGTNRKESTIKNIVDNMQKYGDGSRAEIYVVWRNGRSSHVFVAENDGGNIRFIDPQSSKGNVIEYFDRCRTTATEMCRIDNLETTELIKGCCE